MKTKITLVECDGEVMNAAEKFFHTVGIETYNCMNFREAMESLMVTFAVIVAKNSSMMSDEKFIEKLQEKSPIPVILVEEGATLKITRFIAGGPPSAIHKYGGIKKTDPECWEFAWQELQKFGNAKTKHSAKKGCSESQAAFSYLFKYFIFLYLAIFCHCEEGNDEAISRSPRRYMLLAMTKYSTL